MTIAIETHLVMRTFEPTDILLQYEAAAIPEQVILHTSSQLGEALHCARIAADEDVGQRCWLRLDGQFEVHYRAEVEVMRVAADLATLPSMPPHLLPADTVKYLFDSRYCQGDSFQSYATSEFGDLSGGARIDAMRQ